MRIVVDVPLGGWSGEILNKIYTTDVVVDEIWLLDRGEPKQWVKSASKSLNPVQNVSSSKSAPQIALQIERNNEELQVSSGQNTI